MTVAGSLLELSTITESDLVAMCYNEIHDSQMLKEVAAPTGASDVFANIGEVKNQFSRQMVDLAFEFDDLS